MCKLAKRKEDFFISGSNITINDNKIKRQYQ